jgi:hypothetical protein
VPHVPGKAAQGVLGRRRHVQRLGLLSHRQPGRVGEKRLKLVGVIELDGFIGVIGVIERVERFVYSRE